MNRHGVRPDAFNTILWGGLVAGTLDAVDAVIAFGWVGMDPLQVLQFIASGLLGPAALNGGLPTAVVGAVLQFSVTFTLAAVYYAIALRASILVRKPIVIGLAFGAAVFLVMNYGVLPFSAAPRRDFPSWLLLHRVIGHALFIGVPIALFATRPRSGDAAHKRAGHPVAF